MNLQGMTDSLQTLEEGRMARPTEFTLVLADQICERPADGESLRNIYLGDKMPGKATVFRWLRSHEKFRDRYVHPREAQADALFDENLDIADEDCTMVWADSPSTQGDGVKASLM
ncbi:hypothetical protein [Comamonas odontotermitis]|uniref:terminase small subunit-like protein n=1 Tax=Comamonas odontotermitis TaxID=379895 RepID=UPI003751543C